MSKAIEKSRAKDAGSVSIRRGAKQTDGAVAAGYWDVNVYGTAEVVFNRGYDSAEGVFVEGQKTTISKKLLDSLPEGTVEVLATPVLKESWRKQANLVVNEGLDHLLDSTLAGGTQITTWYVGLTDDTPSPAAGDTMSSHAGWTEFDEYSEAARQTWANDAVSAQSVDNATTPATFSINNDTNGGLGGLFLTSDSTKGGTTGTLYSAVALDGGNRVVTNGDTVEATYTFTMADDGV